MADAVSQLHVCAARETLLDCFIQYKGCKVEQISSPFHLYLCLFSSSEEHPFCSMLIWPAVQSTQSTAVGLWLKATFHLTISMRGERATGKIQKNNYQQGSRGPSLTGKTSSVSLIFTHRTHRNVKNR